KCAGIGKGVQDHGAIRQGEVRRDVMREQAATIVALIQKEAGRVSLLKAEFEFDAIFTDGKEFRRRFAEEQRGIFVANVAAEKFVISATRFKLFKVGQLLFGEFAFGLRQEIIAE